MHLSSGDVGPCIFALLLLWKAAADSPPTFDYVPKERLDARAHRPNSRQQIRLHPSVRKRSSMLV
jgi:hypothetical protein